PVPQFVTEIRAHPTASPSLSPGARPAEAETGGWPQVFGAAAPDAYALQPPAQPAIAERFHFSEGIEVEANAAIPIARFPRQTFGGPQPDPRIDGCAPPIPDEAEPLGDQAPSLSSLKPLGQLRESFILAVNHDGLAI